jgi:hypothetical protein
MSLLSVDYGAGCAPRIARAEPARDDEKLARGLLQVSGVTNLRGRRQKRLTADERRSLTHGDFWIPDDERQVYKRALEALNDANVPYVVAGAYAIYEHTGIYRKTKDLDLFFEPSAVLAAARALRGVGFVTRLEDQHWLAKATSADFFVDLIFGMGNGIALIDHAWVEHSHEGILAGTPVRIAPPEELVWHRLFISERHRHDVADILHLLLCLGDTFDWRRLVDRVGPNWPLLLAQLTTFSYVYPGYRSNVPSWVYDQLFAKAQAEVRQDDEDVDLTRGTLISRFSFTIDVREWGFYDPRNDLVRLARTRPEVLEIVASDVWDERADERAEPPREAVFPD